MKEYVVFGRTNSGGIETKAFGSLTLERAGVSEPGDFKTLPLDFDFSEE